MPKPSAQDKKKLEKITAKIAKPQASSRKLQAEERLQQLPIEKIMGLTNGYSCAEAGNVTGLNPIKRTYKTLKP